MSSMYTTTGNTLTIPKLSDDGSNWVEFESKARNAMGSKGLIRYIDGAVIEPKPHRIVAGISIVATIQTAAVPEVPATATKPLQAAVPAVMADIAATESEIDARTILVDAYWVKEYSARHIITNAVSPRLAALVSGMASSALMWSATKLDATDKSQMFKVDAKARLQSMKVSDGGDVKAHLNAMIATRNELFGISITIPDEDFSTMIIGSLPKSYRQLLSNISAASKITQMKIDPNDLIRLVNEEVDFRARDEKTAPGDSALYTASGSTKKPPRSKGKSPGARSEHKSDAVCHNCDRTGHLRSECWRAGGGKEGQGPKQKAKRESESANVASKETKAKENFAFTCTSDYAHLSARNPPVEAILDSGASSHFCPDRSKFTTFDASDRSTITTADGRVLEGAGRGNVTISLPNGTSQNRVTLLDAVYAPQMPFTLISIHRLDEAKCDVRFGSGLCTIRSPDGRSIATVPSSGGLYRLGISAENAKEHANLACSKMSLMEAHRRLGHISCDSIAHAIEHQLITGIEITKDSKESFCEACAKSKNPRKPFPQEASNRATKLGARVHVDLWGPSPVVSLGGARYSVDFHDDFSRWTEIDFLATKDLTQDAYEKYETRLATQKGTAIEVLRTDRGTEFLNKRFSAHLERKGTVRELTIHDTHEQVGVAERFNRTKAERARALLLQSNLPRFLWAEAMSHVVWLKNRTPTRALLGRTPFESRFGTKPNLASILPFGASAWVKVVGAGKLDSQARKGRFVGYDSQSKGYRIYSPEQRRVSVEREVVFNEGEAFTDIEIADDQETDSEKSKVLETPATPADREKLNAKGKEEEEAKSSPSPAPILRSPSVPSGPPAATVEEITSTENLGRGQRSRPPAGHYRAANSGKALEQASTAIDEGTLTQMISEAQTSKREEWDDLQDLALSATIGTAPRSLQRAFEGPNGPEWRAAAKKETDQMIKLKTFEVVDRPAPEVPVLPVLSVLKEKTGPDGNIVQRKVRFVAGGHKQVRGVNFEETFSSAANAASNRVILALGAQRNWEIHQVDVKSAYLNADLDIVVYMEAPPGILGPGEEGRVVRLLKGLYGLKQAGRIWQQKLTKVFVSIGYVRSRVDHSVFVRNSGQDTTIIAVSTDDMIVVGDSIAAIVKFKADIGNHLEISDLGEIHWLLGFEIKRDRQARTISINQRAYIEGMAEKFGLTSAKAINTPMEAGATYSTTECPTTPINAPYLEGIGSVLWAAMVSRPDALFATGTLAQFSQNPADIHWKAVKRIMVYLFTTRDLWLTIGGADATIQGFVDADWASQDHRHSVSGYAFQMGGGTVSWFSKKQNIVALSSTEAEYIAVTHAAKEVLWIRSFLHELQVIVDDPITLHCDNQSAIALTKDAKFHARTKHIDIRYHFIREAVDAKKLAIIYVPTDDNIADIFTKPLSRIKLEHFVRLLGLRYA